MSPAGAALAATTARRDRPVLACYLPVGDPQAVAATAAFYVEHGVDVIEAGIPVQDPYLDGPLITSSMERALAAGVDTGTAADLLARQLGDAGGPAAVWMSYCSEPSDDYLGAVEGSGAGGALLLGGDPRESGARLRTHGVHHVPFLDHVPTVQQVDGARSADCYAMLAAAPGVTGARDHVKPANRETVADLRARGVTAAVLLGFGIASGAQARAAVDLGADGVVVGSACLRAALAGRGTLGRLLDELRCALDG